MKRVVLALALMSLLVPASADTNIIVFIIERPESHERAQTVIRNSPLLMTTMIGSYADGRVHALRVSPDQAVGVYNECLASGAIAEVCCQSYAVPLTNTPSISIPNDPLFGWDAGDPLVPYFDKTTSQYNTYYVRSGQWNQGPYDGSDSLLYNSYGMSYGVSRAEHGAPRTDVHNPESWVLTNDTSSILVAVLDGGIDPHPDLLANIWTNTLADYYATNVIDTFGGVRAYGGTELIPELADHGYGHGTMCAGIIGAVGNNGIGICGGSWKANIISLAAPRYSEIEYVPLIDYAIRRGVKVVNCSWKLIGSGPALRESMIEAGKHGIIFVVSADNSSTDHDTNGIAPLSWGLPNVIGVTYTDHDGEIDPFAGWGSTNVFIAAPGRRIISTLSLNYTNTEASGVPIITNGYAYFTGTSCAAPMVTEAIARLMAYYPGITLDEIKTRLSIGSDRNQTLVGRTVSGGRLNVYNTLAWTPPIMNIDVTNSRLTIAVSPIGSYEVVSSTNLVDWTPFASVTNTTMSIPIDMTSSDAQFFRFSMSNK